MQRLSEMKRSRSGMRRRMEMLDRAIWKLATLQPQIELTGIIEAGVGVMHLGNAIRSLRDARLAYGIGYRNLDDAIHFIQQQQEQEKLADIGYSAEWGTNKEA